jgi:hypothetical protein
MDIDVQGKILHDAEVIDNKDNYIFYCVKGKIYVNDLNSTKHPDIKPLSQNAEAQKIFDESSKKFCKS